MQTFIFIWIGFALHKLISQFQLCMMCHFLWLNLQKDFISTRCCFCVDPKQKISELHKGTKRLQCSSDFMNKIDERSNTGFFQPNRLSDWSPGKLFFCFFVFCFKHDCMNSKYIYHLRKNLTI